MEKNIFEDLSSSISERERKDLLKKINLSMNINPGIDESIYNVEVSREDKNRMIIEDLKHLGFFERLIIKIRQIFTGKSEEAVYTSIRFRQLKKSINRKMPGITGFETRNISRNMGEIVYNLYLKVSPLILVFRDFWSQGETFHLVLSELINERMEGAVRDIDDLITNEEIEKILYDNETKGAIRDEVLKKLNLHIKKIPQKIFDEIEDEIMPLYYFRTIVLFPYFQFLKLFGFDSTAAEGSYSFKSASAMLCLEHLEKLYYAVYMVLKVTTPIRINELVGKYFYRSDSAGSGGEVYMESSEDNSSSSEEGEEEGESADKKNGNKPGEELDWFYSRLNDIYAESRKISRKVPLIELIKYFRNDIYYKLAFYIPRLKLKDFYYSNLKIHLLEQVDTKYTNARNVLIEKNIDRFFNNIQLKKFMHYRYYTSFDYNKIGVTYFHHVKTLEILFNYLDHYYNNQYRNLIDIVARVVLSQDKITANSIMVQLSTLDDSLIKIKDFDNSLGPDEDDGKLFLRLRYGLGNDNAYLKMYKSFISQKNKVTKDIINKTLESYESILKILTQLLASPSYEVKNTLNMHYMINGKTKTFKEHITECMDNIKYFKSLVVQLMKFEEGR